MIEPKDQKVCSKCSDHYHRACAFNEVGNEVGDEDGDEVGDEVGGEFFYKRFYCALCVKLNPGLRHLIIEYATKQMRAQNLDALTNELYAKPIWFKKLVNSIQPKAELVEKKSEEVEGSAGDEAGPARRSKLTEIQVRERQRRKRRRYRERKAERKAEGKAERIQGDLQIPNEESVDPSAQVAPFHS